MEWEFEVEDEEDQDLAALEVNGCDRYCHNSTTVQCVAREEQVTGATHCVDGCKSGKQSIAVFIPAVVLLQVLSEIRNVHVLNIVLAQLVSRDSMLGLVIIYAVGDSGERSSSSCHSESHSFCHRDCLSDRKWTGGR